MVERALIPCRVRGPMAALACRLETSADVTGHRRALVLGPVAADAVASGAEVDAVDVTVGAGRLRVTADEGEERVVDGALP